MRFFPSADESPRRRRRRRRRRQLAAYAVLALVCSGITATPAHADENHRERVLKHRQQLVQGRVRRASQMLDESSKAYARASARLDQARTELHQARARLQRVRDRLGDARRQADRLQRELKDAQARLDKAAAALREAQDKVADQRDELRGRVIGEATQGNPELDAFSSLLDSGSVEDVIVSQTASGLVVGRESDVLSDLEDAEAAVEDHKNEVEAARNKVERKKDAADRTVQRVHGLVTDARETRERVGHLVTKSARARRAAARARAHDREVLQRVQKREDRIKQRILALSRRQSGSYTGPTDGLLLPPVNGTVTSPFGWRIHPIYGYWGLHNGVDIGAACGAPLVASASGTVIDEYYDEVDGNRLFLAIGKVNGNTITLIYNHMAGYAVGEGARVARGQLVGRVGDSGWSTGCHVHLTVMRNGTPVDPMGYL